MKIMEMLKLKIKSWLILKLIPSLKGNNIALIGAPHTFLTVITEKDFDAALNIIRYLKAQKFRVVLFAKTSFAEYVGVKRGDQVLHFCFPDLYYKDNKISRDVKKEIIAIFNEKDAE